MKPSPAELEKLCPEVDPRLIQAHLTRLDERYFQRFDQAAIARHLRGLATLSSDHPVEVLLDFAGPQATCTILAFDYQSEFSLLTGVMASLGFSIQNGGVHTYRRTKAPAASARRGPASNRQVVVPLLERRRIVDHFVGRVETGQSPADWANAFRQQVSDVIGLLEKNGEAGLIEAKHRVNEMVSSRLSSLALHTPTVLYPMQITLDNSSGEFTRLTVVSEDTPAFLYALSNALSLRKISIEHVRISTAGQRVEDTLDFVDESGRAIQDSGELDQVRLSVLLTKQFTYFLEKAPDPYAALSRFEHLVEDVLRLPRSGHWVEMLSSPRILQDLARLLGASDFLWEDMIRLQYETLLPMLAPHTEGRRFVEPVETLPARLETALAGAHSLEEKKQRLNEFKDQEIFRIDLDHILTPGADFETLAEHLTKLAEAVVQQAVQLNHAGLAARFGRPRTVAGIEAKWAVAGLGKFGGAALGYASDIELLFVYSDNGQTDGPEPITNLEFFDRLIRAVTKFIVAKREGIFNIDLRLRPFGTDGPLPCSLESFCQYYGPGGQALSYERLALVRLRAVAGDPELGAQVERLRDDFIYASRRIDIAELRSVRAKQFEEKTRGGGLNAKFSPGALVDLEYDVQLLQVMYGQDNPALRTPRIHQALQALKDAGVLDAEECAGLSAAYDFLRELINGLRMLRGSAKDLFLPPADSPEYLHLARRLGYIPKDGLDPARQLHLDFETQTATVRTFVDRHFGRDALPGPVFGTVADLVLSETVPQTLRWKIFQESGFHFPERADTNLKNLAGGTGQRRVMARLAVLAFDLLSQQPDPDMALNNWERFVAPLPDAPAHFERLLSQPMRLEILLKLFSTSQFLADALIRHPGYFDWATDPSQLRDSRSVEAQRTELHTLKDAHPRDADWRNALRRFRRREFVRIGIRDLCLHASLESVTLDLSNLADALIQAALDQAWQRLRLKSQAGKTQEYITEQFCIFAFGKLGGQELNYSSDIDLVGVCADGADPEACRLALEQVHADLSQHTEEGYVYRVDLRLRPYGISGQLVSPESGLVEYYARSAALSEIQALLKARPVAGNRELGQRFLERVRPIVLAPRERAAVVAAIQAIRQAALKKAVIPQAHDVKSGLGGIRDIEFMVQGLQLLHGPEHPGLLTGNTLEGLRRLGQAGILSLTQAEESAEDYILLRRIEHYLQIRDDQQIHVLPQHPEELAALAKRMLGQRSSADEFLHQLEQRLARVREAYIAHLVAPPRFTKVEPWPRVENGK